MTRGTGFFATWAAFTLMDLLMLLYLNNNNLSLSAAREAR